MSTKAQIKANRQNAKKSTGPKTPEGKAAVSQNATKHGLLSHRDVISSESQADFDLHRDQFLQELNPETHIQSFIADRIVSLSWRLKRAEIIQNQAMDYLDERNDKSPIVKMTQAMLLKLYPVPEDDDDDPPLNIPLGKMAVRDYNNARVLDRLLLYERRIESSLHKTMQEYQKLKLINNINTEQEKPLTNNENQSKSKTRFPNCLAPSPVDEVMVNPVKNSESSVSSVAKNKKMSNKPNLVLSKVERTNVTPFPTSNYGKFQSLQKPENQGKSALGPVHRSLGVDGTLGEPVPNPLSSYNFSDEEWERLIAFTKKEKKPKNTKKHNQTISF